MSFFKKAGLAAATGGLSLLGKDTLFGKKESPYSMQSIQLTPEQQRQNELRMSELEQLHKAAVEKPDYAGIESDVRRDLFGKERLAQGAYEDQKRKLNELSAQRGLGNSSVGLSQLTGLNKAYTENLANIRGMAPSMVRAEKERQKANYFNKLLSSASAKGLSTPQYYQQQKAQRSGGLFGIATTLGGAALGGLGSGGTPQGAAAGAQIGAGLGQAGTSLFG